MQAAVALGESARGSTAPNPNVGCVIVRDGEIVARGATRPGGRPHAEAVALAAAGDRARGATAYVTLEPCAHDSARGPACAQLLRDAGVARVVAALKDPDPRTNGGGFALLREAGIEVACGPAAEEAARSLAGFLTRLQRGRPFVTLKLAMSIDGCIAMASGESRWITGEEARHDVHIERAQSDMILVGRGTYEADHPSLDVRIEGMEDRSPRRALLTRGAAPYGWTAVAAPEAIAELHDVNDLLVEGGAGAASAFLAADLVDRLIVYRAPILIGEGIAALGEIGLRSLAEAHGRWTPIETRMLGIDRREVYERRRT
ncbi:MAG: bifunctional diaminohydroxyphosphoribosylaminopyrimidine deaminase/5-amino-6-(5-phosphoribosylamino)uracil reductase RibD [Sphingomonadales bacterium]